MQNVERPRQIARIRVDAGTRRQDLRRALRFILDEPVEQFVGCRRGAVFLQYRGRPQQRGHGVVAALHLRVQAQRVSPDHCADRRSRPDSRRHRPDICPARTSSANLALAASRCPS